MAGVRKPRYGVHVYYYGDKDRRSWYDNPEAQDRAYTPLKRQAEVNREKAVPKRSDVRYVKKVQRG